MTKRQIEVSRVGDIPIYYIGQNSYEADGKVFRSEEDAFEHLEIKKLWDEAPDVKLMRIEFPYLQKWYVRWIKRSPKHRGRWYTTGHSVMFNENTGKEEVPHDCYREDRPRPTVNMDGLFIFDQAKWDEAKILFMAWRAAEVGIRKLRTSCTAPRENETWSSEITE